MTKKHFEILAYRLAMVEPEGNGTARDLWIRCVTGVAEACRDCNPRFDQGKFTDACRFDYWTNHKPPKGV